MNMKSKLVAFIVFFLSMSSAAFAVEGHSPKFWKIPLAGNAYKMNSGLDNKNHPENGLSKDAISVYFSASQQQRVKLSLYNANEINLEKIQVKINGKKFDVLLRDTGYVSLGIVQLRSGYNVLEIIGFSARTNAYQSITELKVSSTGPLELNYVREGSNGRFYFGRRGPSVHLNYKMPEKKDIKWFYNEVTVPVGQDVQGSYFMANGFREGYFGMQVNSPTERRILFSVWSPFHTDNPKDIPADQRITLLKKGDNVQIGEFGNEGSGGQSFLRYYWSAGQTYKFLNSVEPDGRGNTVYTAYFFDPIDQKWLLVASFSRPQTNTWYTSAHSFLENFNPNGGYLSRRVLFGSQWVCDKEGQWYEITTARFTGDDIAGIRYRLDREGGLESNSFYLKNCGFFNSSVSLNSTFQRVPSAKKPIVEFDNLP